MVQDPYMAIKTETKSNTSQFPYEHQRNFFKEGTRANRIMKLKRSADDMIQSGTSTTICYSSTAKRSGATVEDVTPGIHMEAQYGHSDRG